MLNFPDSPTANQVYTVGAASWSWDGAKWTVSGAGGVAYAPLASPTFTGDPKAPTPATADNDTSIATTAYVQAQGYATAASVTAGDNLRVLKAGDTMTGPLTIANNGTGLVLSAATAQDSYLELHNGTTSDWKVGTQGVTSAGEFWIYNLKTSSVAMRIDQSGALDIGGVHAFPIFAISSGTYTNLLSPDSAGNQQGGIVLGGSSDPEHFYRNGSHRFADRAGGTNYAAFTSVGTYNVSGAWITFSDVSLKENIAPYERGLEAIVALQPVQFRYAAGTPFASADAPSRELFGLIADQVRPHVPEIVGTATGTVRGEELLLDTLEPGNLIYALINAVKELEARLAALEAKPA